MYNPYKPKASFENLQKSAETNEPIHKPKPTFQDLKKLCTPTQNWLEKCMSHHPSYIEMQEMNSTGTIEYPFYIVTESEKAEYMKRHFNSYRPHVKDDSLLSHAFLTCTVKYYKQCTDSHLL
jgi:hypothetical protein